eukprot:5182974-Pleurochrysis_carterae.AAC.1
MARQDTVRTTRAAGGAGRAAGVPSARQGKCRARPTQHSTYDIDTLHTTRTHDPYGTRGSSIAAAAARLLHIAELSDVFIISLMVPYYQFHTSRQILTKRIFPKRASP